MPWKLIVIVILTLGHLYKLALDITGHRSTNHPIPQNVADVYDPETYEKWRRYRGENSRLGLITDLLSYAITLTLLLTDAYAAVAGLLPAGMFWQLLAVILLESLIGFVVHGVLNYISTMVIEEKYGFNRSTMKTFVADQLRMLAVELLLSLGLSLLLGWLHGSLGDWMILLFAAAVFVVTLIISFLYPILSRLGNKFTPLEEGELKERLVALLTKHGYQVKAIEVMDASRRTTKMNAYFTGFGKLKTIVLYDTLVEGLTTDEICAVFAHELGHGIHKDVLKQQTLNFVNLLGMAVAVWLAVRWPEMHAAFGFAGVNYGFGYILAGIGLGLVTPLLQLGINAYSRHAEYRADRQAVAEGYGEALVTALKKLARENFSHLSPSPVLVALEYSHPPLSQRIDAIEKANKK